MRNDKDEGVEVIWRRNGPPRKIAVPTSTLKRQRNDNDSCLLKPAPPKAYRLGFGVERIGRIRPDTKRRYKWCVLLVLAVLKPNIRPRVVKGSLHLAML